MQSAKNIALAGVFTALLIGGQLALSGVAGVEIVTVMLLTFCYKYGAKIGLLVATAFSLLRCFLFGFAPNIIVLYLVYYNLFALVFGGVGNLFDRRYGIEKHIAVIVLAVVMTASFTLLDDIITPLMYSYTPNATKTYFFASLYVMAPQLVCSFVTTLLIFPPLLKILIPMESERKDTDKPINKEPLSD